MESRENARLFRVLLGGILVDVSNIKVSGKGRRYRNSWQTRNISVGELDEKFLQAIEHATVDIVRYSNRREKEYSLLRGDSREKITETSMTDLVLFSPPYPNSFDYTDVYNVELWMLRYLKSFSKNRSLRKSTLVSHVQVSRDFGLAPQGSKTLVTTMENIEKVKDQLWDKRLVAMIGGYFSDMLKIMHACSNKLVSKGQMWMVVGDSKYAGVHIPVAKILCELASVAQCKIIREQPFRSMRASAQQGGNQELPETLIVMEKY